MVRLRGLLACCALTVALRGGADAGRWPQPVLGETPSPDLEVLFTFDDGPKPGTTTAVLDILAQHKIRAVFFLVGQQVLSQNPEVPVILERIVRDGHIIANHTMGHTDLCKGTDEEAVADLDGGREVLEHATGMRLSWFRAPFGVRCDRLDAMLAERNLSHFHWDLDPQEWKHGSVDKTVKSVTGELARASGRNVLLLHDIKQVTVAALPKILEWMAEEDQRRAKERRPRIKILQAPDIAVERVSPAVLAWLADVIAGARTLPKAIASVLP
jgi:peptidoglycan/xylan/chitin deacetylase (PgdA/CDA1 family)